MTVDLATLDGSLGFRIDGIDAFDRSGASVASAGDVNGDGIDDLIIGAPFAGVGSGRGEGDSYVVFGRATGFDASLQLGALDGSNGFRIDGIAIYDRSGNSVASAGDVNGDGFADLLIGAFGADPGAQNSAGESYVVFGRSGGFDAALSLAALDGTDGFRLVGIDALDFSGDSVAGAGDVNGDGIDDLIIGASGADVGPNGSAGESYVVFGRTTGFDASLSLLDLNGQNGFRVTGIDAFEYVGSSVAGAGDVNGDGIGDLVIGGSDFDTADGYQGQAYVVFGRSAGFAQTLPLDGLNGATGFRIDGGRLLGRFGLSVASAGDVNGDGIDDLIVGSQFADPNGQDDAGSSFVVFGTAAGFDATLSLDTLDGANGFRLNGVARFDDSGISVASAGDVNGDGIDDLIIGAPGANPNGDNNAGQVYVVFGQRDRFDPVLSLGALDGPNGFVIDGIEAYSGSGGSVASAGDVNGDGLADIVFGAQSANELRGTSYVVFGIDHFGAVSDRNAATDSVLETAARGATVGVTALAFDGSAPGTVRYDLIDSADGRFAINNTTGVVRLAGALNFETAVRHQIIVRATAQDGSQETAAFLIQVGDAPEPLGAIRDASVAANQVAEAAVVGTRVNITARAIDPDPLDQISYALTDNAGGRFGIDARTGIVTVAGALDFESAASHQITVRATSSGGDSQSTSFTIAVLDSNDPLGPVSDREIRANRVAESAAPGTQVGLIAQAIDQDVRDRVSYDLTDSASGRFAIDAVTGVVTVAGSLDFETARSHQITVRATSTGSGSQVAAFTIAVTNADDPLGTITDAVRVGNRVAEDAAIGTRVNLTARAFDQDRGDRVSYALTNDADGRFAIDSRTGVVTVAGPLDFETARSHQITVQATSSGGGSQSASFAITVTDVADITPIPGTAGPDRLTGSRGDDIFTPGAGADVMSGRGGDDVFVFALETRNSVAERDTITDFAPGDLLDLGDARIFREFNVNGTTLLVLDGDGDQIRFPGLADFDPLTMLA